MKEIWKTVPGFPSHEVSNFGNVRSWAKLFGRMPKIPRLRKLCINKKTGYTQVMIAKSINKKMVYKTFNVHRLVLSSFSQNKNSSNLDAAHLDGNRQNNNLSNLRWCTRKENEKQKDKHGTRPVGSKCSYSKLNERMARAIRILYQEYGISQSALSDIFDVHVSTINPIITRRTWKHILL